MISSIREGIDFDDVLIVPKYNEIESRASVSLGQFIGPYRFKSPLISANMNTVTGIEMALAMDNLGGLGILHRFMSVEDNVLAVKQMKAEYETRQTVDNRERVIAVSVGVGADERDRVGALYDTGARFICIDIAHGHSKAVVDMIKHIKGNFPGVYVIAGNIATAEAASTLQQAGADMVKVGIGPGANCITRKVTGCGYPQLAAIMEVSKVKGIKIIADGGIRNSGDIAKAIVAGANMVMIGSLFAGAEESPALRNAQGDKEYAGMASFKALLDKKEAMGQELVVESYRSEEGIVTNVPYTGPIKTTVDELHAGLRSAMTYTGSDDLETFRDRVEFVRMR